MKFGRFAAAVSACLGLSAVRVSAQGATPYTDPSSGITYVGYTDTTLDMTLGFVFPPLQPTGSSTPNSTEYIVQIVAPASYGWSGLSAGGQMADSLLFTLWPNGDDIILGTRWTSGYVLPDPYPGPTLTLLPDSTVNSTHIKASFRCQNCTAWTDGSIGGGNLNAVQVIAYVASTMTPVDDPPNVDSTFSEHNEFNFFGLDLSTAHSSDYSSYVSGSSSATTSTPASTSAPASTSTVATVTSSASGATQTKYGQCGGTGWSGPTVCASGSTCVAVSPPYYSQCQ